MSSFETRNSPIHKNEVTPEFPYRYAEKRDEEIGLHKSKKNCNGTAQQWNESEESHPGTVSSHELLSFVKFLFTYMQVAFFPMWPTP